jgi:hypothetical protein
LKPSLNKSSPPCGAVVPCDVIAHASVRATPAEVRQFRQNLILPSGERLPPGFLKHAEDQTVTGLMAVCRAIANEPDVIQDLPAWGVLGAPRFLGRVAMISAIQKFLLEGAWGLSPHLIPHRLLHALSGTISQALKINGPNFGVGGGPSGVSEGLLASAAMLHAEGLPGVWVVFTGCDPEADGENSVHVGEAGACNALALALVAARPETEGLRVRVGGLHNSGMRPTGSVQDKSVSLETLQVLVAELNTGESAADCVHQLGEGLTLERVGAASSHPAPNGVTTNGNGRLSHRTHIETVAEKKS